MSSRRRFRSVSRRKFLMGLGGGCVGIGAVSMTGGTIAFNNVTGNRTTDVLLADDPNAYVGMTINDPVKKNNREPLVDIENNTDETVDVTVSLNDCTKGTLYDSDESGCSVTLTIDPGVIKTVDIEASVADTILFTVSATSPTLSFDATRQTTAQTGSTGPTADAGGPYSVDEGKTVELDGTGSSGNIQSYSWQITSGPGSLTDASTATPVYHAPDVSSDTNVTVELTVTDNKGQTDTDTATITVNETASDPPSVDSMTVTEPGPRSFSISADVSDPDGNLDRVEIAVVRTKNGKTDYSATLTGISGSSDSISDTTDQLKKNEEYRIEVTVYDTSGLSDTETRTRTTG